MPVARSKSRSARSARKSPALARRKAAAKRTTTSARKASPDHPSAGISRVDQPSRRTHGYVVRLDYRKTPTGYRPRLTAFFGDVSHGGRRAAWEAAEKWLTSQRRKSRKS